MLAPCNLLSIFLIKSSVGGKSAACVRRIIIISAAIIGLGATVISSRDFISICHIRVSTRIDNSFENATPRIRSSGVTVGSSFISGVIFATDIQCVISAKSLRITIGSAPSEYCEPSSFRADAASPCIIISKRSNTLPRSAMPSIALTCFASLLPPPWLIAWSRRDVASLAEPSAALVIIRRASSETFTPSEPAIFLSSSIISSGSILLRSNLWQRDRTVTGTFRISVVAKINFTCSGGSSSVFNSALNALLDNM